MIFAGRPQNLAYLGEPDLRTQCSRNQMNGYNWELSLCHINSAEPHRSRHIRLPVGAVEERNSTEALQEKTRIYRALNNPPCVIHSPGRTASWDSGPVGRRCTPRGPQTPSIWSHSHGRKVRPTAMRYSCVAPASRRWSPDSGRWTNPARRASRSNAAEPQRHLGYN